MHFRWIRPLWTRSPSLATPTVTAALGKLGFEFTYATGISPLAPPEGGRMVGRARTLRFIHKREDLVRGPVRGPGVVTSSERAGVD